MEAFEFSRGKVFIEKQCVFPGEFAYLQQSYDDFEIEADTAVSKELSCGVTFDDDGKLLSILFGTSEYYE